MSRHKLPFNDSVEIIWNEDGRYGTGYHTGRDDTFTAEQAKNTALDAVALTGAAAVALVFFGPMIPIIAPLALFNEIAEKDW